MKKISVFFNKDVKQGKNSFIVATRFVYDLWEAVQRDCFYIGPEAEVTAITKFTHSGWFEYDRVSVAFKSAYRIESHISCGPSQSHYVEILCYSLGKKEPHFRLRAAFVEDGQIGGGITYSG